MESNNTQLLCKNVIQSSLLSPNYAKVIIVTVVMTITIDAKKGPVFTFNIYD